jgi:hypothetical protein
MRRLRGLAIAALLGSSSCALGYYLHAKEEKLRQDAVLSTRCQDVEVLEHDDAYARVRACVGAVWKCHFKQLVEPTGPLSTHHGQWICEL